MTNQLNARQPQKVSIRPGVSVLSVLAHLNYRPWFALAEFVDNSLESFLKYREQFSSDENEETLRVSIEISPVDQGRITIRDNAAGIADSEFSRAFRPAQVPTDRSGLCEFGMGMKSAACWFSPVWHVRTSAIGETVEKCIQFDISHIVRDELEELDVVEVPAESNVHFTEIVLEQLHRVPTGRTLGKIKDHLSEIYRVYTRDGLLELSLNGEVLCYREPAVLEAPVYDANKQPIGDELLWRKSIEFDFGQGLQVTGFAALRQKASTTHAGFSLFRRNRLIQGSGDEKYRPSIIFGQSNDYPYQRLFGELHLSGFDVTHTKDGFQWDQNEQAFLELLKEHLNTDPLPLIKQARNFRTQPTRGQLRRASGHAVQRTGRSLEREFPTVANEISQGSPEDDLPEQLCTADLAAQRVLDFDLDGRRWRVILELTDDEAVGDWLEVSNAASLGDEQGVHGEREILGLRMSVVHPFVRRFAGADAERLEPLFRVAAAIGLGEKLAREGGIRMAGVIRVNINKILRRALSET